MAETNKTQPQAQAQAPAVEGEVIEVAQVRYRVLDHISGVPGARNENGQVIAFRFLKPGDVVTGAELAGIDIDRLTGLKVLEVAVDEALAGE